MDLSKEYLEMCAKAHEIQNHKPAGGKLITKETETESAVFSPVNYWSKGDWFVQECDFDNVSDVVMIGNGLEDSANQERCENDTWLPRQDQFQEIINESDKKYKVPVCKPVTTLALFTQWVFNSGLMLWSEDVTLEMLWLMYVMEQVYFKTWDNKTKVWVEKEMEEEHERCPVCDSILDGEEELADGICRGCGIQDLIHE